LVVKNTANTVKVLRMTIGAVSLTVLTAKQVGEVPFQIAEHNQVEPPIVVQIHPGRGGGPPAAAGSGSLGHIGKFPGAVVVVEVIATVSRHIEVFLTVIIVVAHRDAHVEACAG